MNCKSCGKPFSEEDLKIKAKKKSDLIKIARKEAKARGEQVGAKQKYDRQKIKDLRDMGLSIRAIAKIMGCSTSPVMEAIN